MYWLSVKNVQNKINENLIAACVFFVLNDWLKIKNIYVKIKKWASSQVIIS